MLIDYAISVDKNVVKNKSPEDSKIQGPYNRHTGHAKCKNKSDKGDNRGD